MTNKMFKPEPDIDIRSFPKISQLSKRTVLTYLPKTEIQLASYNNCTTKHHEINCCPTLSLKQNCILCTLVYLIIVQDIINVQVGKIFKIWVNLKPN